MYCVGDAIGKGDETKVLSAHHRQTQCEVAIKIFDTTDKSYEGISQIVQEADILSSLDHPYILPFFDLVIEPFQIGIVTYMMEMNLVDYVD